MAYLSMCYKGSFPQSETKYRNADSMTDKSIGMCVLCADNVEGLGG